jgi:hypothetical protein
MINLRHLERLFVDADSEDDRWGDFMVCCLDGQPFSLQEWKASGASDARKFVHDSWVTMRALEFHRDCVNGYPKNIANAMAGKIHGLRVVRRPPA